MTSMAASGNGTCALDGAEFYNAVNVDALASIIQTEAGDQNAATQQAVAWTVMNRMLRNRTRKVTDVWNAYAHARPGRDEARTIARLVLNGDLKDTTHGATHLYTPQRMPFEGQRTNGRHVGGGLESVPGVFGEIRANLIRGNTTGKSTLSSKRILIGCGTIARSLRRLPVTTPAIRILTLAPGTSTWPRG